MDAQFVCFDCGHAHNDPADARLGHLVICLACAVNPDFEGFVTSEAFPQTAIAA